MKRVRRLLAITMIMILCVAGSVPVCTAASYGTIDANINVKYGQTEARTMLAMINNFRTGNQAWYWNQDNRTKTWKTNLKPLTYDYDLEQVAMQRAAELAIAFQHQRPNGEDCFSAVYNGTSSCGENIAAGNHMDAARAFYLWQENDYGFEGQGHRRNMLGEDYTSVGIGYAYYNGVHFWVQEFGWENSGAARTAANDSAATVAVEISSDMIRGIDLISAGNNVRVDVGKSVAIPQPSVRLVTWSSVVTASVGIDLQWESDDESIATVSGNRVYGQKRGSTYLISDLFGTPVTKDVDVLRSVALERYSGVDRYKTAIQIADALKEELNISKFDSIIVASGSDYPDALAGSYLAKVKKAPILLVNNSSEKEITAYISENLKRNGNVYILGGTGVVSEDFEKGLKTFTDVSRLAGSNRYETNIEILEEAGVPEGESLLICSGGTYADSLSASAVGKPILLVGTQLTDAHEEYLDILGSEHGYIIGGTGAVSSEVENSLGFETDRIAGYNRFETSELVADEFFDYSTSNVTLAYGLNFPDGLAGGPLAMAKGGPLLLATNNTANVEVLKVFTQLADLKTAVILGGPTLVSNEMAEFIVK